MADWTQIQDAQVDPDAPITSEIGYAFRDNPIAIAEGAPGAPRIQDAAMGGTITSAGGTWVANRYSTASIGARGMIVMAVYNGSGDIRFGDTVSGSLLNPSNSEGGISVSPVITLAGTWRCQGAVYLDVGSGPTGTVTNWIRVS